MATERISLGINLRKNKNSQSAGYGKYYPEVATAKTLSLRGFAEHMTDHNSYYPREVVEGVLTQICHCLPELVGQGVPVKLSGLGTFYPTAEVVKDGGVTDIGAMDGLSPNEVVKAIHIRFLPDATKLDNLCGPAFKEACALEFRNIVDTTEVTIEGKTRKFQTLKPIATAVAEWKEANGIGGNGSNGNNGGNGNNEPNTPQPDDPENPGGGSTGGDDNGGGGTGNGNGEDE